MATDLISSYIDRDGVQGDTKFLLDEINKAISAIDKFNSAKPSFEAAKGYEATSKAIDGQRKAQDQLAESSKKIADANTRTSKSIRDSVASIGVNTASTERLSESYDELIKLSVENQIASKGLAAARKELDKSFKDGVVSAEDYTNILEEIKKKEVAVAVSNQDLNRAIRNTEKGFQAETGSLNSLRAELNIALQTFDRLSEASKTSEFGVKLKQRIDELTASISQQEQSTGRFQRNVGNYSGAVSVLEKAFTDVKNKIDQLTASGDTNSDIFERLQKEYQALNNIVSNQANGFVSMREEIRQNEIAIEQLIGIYGEESNVVRQLVSENAELRDSLADLVATQRTIGSDTFAFDALLQGGQALVGIYSAAQGAAALFGDENEDLQKTMVKLQAAIALVQGVQAAVNALQKEGALVQGLLAAKTTLTTAATRVYTFVTGGATVAARAFNTALVAGGIGIVLTLIASAASAMNLFGDETKDAASDLEEFNKQLEFSKELLDSYTDSLQFQTDIDVLRAKKRGATEKELLDITIDGIKKRKEANNLEVKNNEEKLNLLNTNDKDYAEKAQKLTDLITQGKLKAIQYDRQLTKEQLEFDVNSAEDARKKSKASAEKTIEENKALKEREFKAAFELQKFYLQKEADAQKNISDSDAPFKLRADALQNYINLSERLIIAQRDFDLSNSKISASERILIETKANDEILKVRGSLIPGIISIRQQISDADRAQAEKDNEEITAGIKKQEQDRFDALTNGLNSELSYIERSSNQRLTILNNEYAAGKISKQKYEDEKVNIENDALSKSLQAQLTYYRGLVNLYQFDEAKKKEALDKITELEKSLSDLGVKKFDETKDKIKSTADKIKDALIDLQSQIVDTVSGFFQNGFDAKKNEIQDQIDALEEKKQKDIEVANQSITNEQERAAAIATIEARSNAQKEQLERKQRRLDEQKAKFDKARAIANIIQNTAQGVTAALASIPPNVPLAILIGALGAANLAQTIAQPIPKYYSGKSKENSYEGWAIWGDNNRSEAKISADGNVEISPNTPTYTYVRKGDTILPDAKQLIEEDFKLAVSKTGKLVKINPVQKNTFYDPQAERRHREMLKAIKNQPQPILKGLTKRDAIIKYGANATKYLND